MEHREFFFFNLVKFYKYLIFRTNAVIVIDDISDLIIDDKTRKYDKNIEKIEISKYVSKSREMNDSI